VESKNEGLWESKMTAIKGNRQGEKLATTPGGGEERYLKMWRSFTKYEVKEVRSSENSP